VTLQHWASTAKGRSRTVAHGGLIWTVANATDPSADFETQVAQSLAMLEAHLTEAGSARTHLLSLQVILTEIPNRDVFDLQWREWTGPDPAHWPQRVCFQADLAPGLLVELVAVAASASVAQSSG
jgi:enamine deaminase RidA (YjgF/YER057c/UK114 family)